MAYIELANTELDSGITDNRVASFMKKYRDSEKIYDHWKDKYEEAYEYTLPQRESFYEETVGERRTDKIFDETAVVGIQEFASRLQAGITPTFGRWINLKSGIEVKSPIIGTFYRRPSPDKDPFINVGDNINVATVVGIV